MTTSALDTIGQRAAARSPERIGQATAVEQSRAIAEVQAAVVVAQQVPRDQDRALAEMRDACGRMAMASRAFYTVPNRGNGPSVHLARELARIWGNIQSGVHELRRDDAAGESEVQAFAWDLQTNSRTVRTFISPHARMKGRERQALVDIDDIYRSNQNTGAKAVRECILNVLPRWFTEEAQDICRATLENGEGKPLQQRVQEAVDAFSRIQVTLPQLEAKVGRPKGSWTPAHVADLAIVFTSITRDGIDKADVFPPARVTGSDITGHPSAPAAPAAPASGPAQSTPPAADPGEAATEGQIRKLHVLLGEIGLSESKARLEYLTEQLGREVKTSKSLSKAEASKVIDTVEKFLDPSAGEQPVPA